jgi:hypothetical protein
VEFLPDSGPGAVAAAVAAEAEASERRDQVREALGRDLEAARYEADHADRGGIWRDQSASSASRRTLDIQSGRSDRLRGANNHHVQQNHRQLPHGTSIPISKTCSLQRHRQMGVVMQDCKSPGIGRLKRGPRIRCRRPAEHLLVFDAAPQTLDEHVVSPSALAVHADGNVVVASTPVKAEPVNCEPWFLLKISGMP